LTQGPTEARARLVALLAQAGAGRTDALEALYRLTSAKLFGVILRVTQGDRAAAEEILQDSFVKIWRKAALFDEAKASPITWLATIARNTAIDWRRANAQAPVPLSEDDAASELALLIVDGEAELAARSTRHHILDCIARLEPQQASAVRTAFYDGLSHSELAAHLAVPLGTLKSWIRRAMIALRECIDDQG
jgi:RNA polymerase sigma factor (sigma-70 family)